MNYRADLDGIRAIAVLIVILFHFGIGGFSGGYIGVDVFFVLSGYLISSVIFGQLETGKFGFIHFYFRRIRRLFPVYVVVMLVSFALAFKFMLPTDFADFGKGLVASTVYLSNILFYLEAGYFDTASHLKPLLHTWSLSVEEQFYVVFPLLAWLVASLSRRSLFGLFSLLTLVSFGLAVLYIEHNASAVFFLYPFRAWEMFLGTLLATQVIPTLNWRAGNTALSLLGLALILLPSAAYDASTLFPGLSALPPCLGTVLLIYAGSGHTGWVQQILSMKIPVFLGKISYSLYLWHWPVFVFYIYNKPDGTDAVDVALMMLVTFAASVLTWKYVETPFRHGLVKFSDKHTSVFIGTALVSAVFVALGFWVYKGGGMPGRLDPATAQFAKAASDLFGEFDRCEERNNSYFPGVAYCKIGDPLNAERYTLLWGDSHSGAIKPAIEALLDGSSRQVLNVWDGGCPPVFGLDKDETVSSRAIDELCFQRNQAVKNLLESDTRIDAVVLTGRWSYYLHNGGIGTDAHNKIKIWPQGESPDSVADSGAYLMQGLRNTISQLNQRGLKVFVVEQPPEFPNYAARTLAIGLMNGSVSLDQSVPKYAEMNYREVDLRQSRMQAFLAELEAHGEISVLRTHHFFCRANHCSAMLDNVPAYFDNNHISAYGATQIRAMFKPLIEHLEKTSK